MIAYSRLVMLTVTQNCAFLMKRWLKKKKKDGQGGEKKIV